MQYLMFTCGGAGYLACPMQYLMFTCGGAGYLACPVHQQASYCLLSPVRTLVPRSMSLRHHACIALTGRHACSARTHQACGFQPMPCYGAGGCALRAPGGQHEHGGARPHDRRVHQRPGRHRVPHVAQGRRRGAEPHCRVARHAARPLVVRRSRMSYNLCLQMSAPGMFWQHLLDCSGLVAKGLCFTPTPTYPALWRKTPWASTSPSTCLHSP